MDNIQIAENAVKELALSKTLLISKLEDDNKTYKHAIVWKIDGYIQAILYRVVDIAENTLPLWRNEKLIPAIILSRSLMETVSAACWLIQRVKCHLQAGTCEDIDKDVMRLSFSTSMIKDLPDPVNTLTFINSVRKNISNWRDIYNVLSESVHPNSLGTLFAYSEVDETSYEIRFFETFPGAMDWLNQNMPPVLTNSLFLMQKILDDYKELRPLLYEMLKKCNHKNMR